MSGGTPFPVDPVLVGIIQAYKNDKLIADDVLPRLNPLLPKEEFKWWFFDFAQFITLHDTKVGRKSEPNQVEFEAQERTSRTDDYGLDDLIPNVDQANAPAGYDPRAFAAQKLIDLVLLDREVRVANKTMSAATYGVNNKETLTGTSKWTDAASTPIKHVAAAADTMIIRPNNAVCSRSVWTALRTNPSVLRALTPSGSQDGYANKRAVADLLELDDILVGEGWLNIAKPGQSPVRARVWPNKFLLFHKAALADSVSAQPTFGWTAQFGTRVSGSLPQPKAGLRGSELVRSGESVKEVISAPELGYLFEGVI
ncbi:major capsid protein E [Rhizobium subbaraonis]|uniref:Major capsid protein E n=1 Tax=Rhizobium subbaraonis TaxID=908946 RepID=A0A285UI63_9HYPH|nr:major capsid protein [Rhizobium subbaraonis]SOC41570.1 major capsid protein E [Rhizobium subbaraonis]